MSVSGSETNRRFINCLMDLCVGSLAFNVSTVNTSNEQLFYGKIIDLDRQFTFKIKF